MNVDIELTPKQSKCWKLLLDDTTTSICYGGGVGGGKSFLLCLWFSYMCIQYPGTRYLIGRYSLQNLKLTTLKTLFEVLSMMGLESETHYKFNAQSNVLTFNNKSEIVLRDLAPNLIDPEYNRLGSSEFTQIGIDEAAEVPELAIIVLKTRLRFKLNEYNLKGKMLFTTNPSNNWVKRTFYTPYVENRLEPDKAFIQSLPNDNKHLPQSYLESINTLPKMQRDRLVLGDWNYMDNNNDSMFNYDDIVGSYHKYEIPITGKFTASCDISRFGDDKAVMIIWKDLCIVEINIWNKLDTIQLTDKIRERMIWYKIPSSQVIIDSDGVGAGSVDILRAKGFVNNSSPLYNQNYTNLKAQCYYVLSDKFKRGEISININQPEIMDKIIEELSIIKMRDYDKDKKLAIISKDEMKKILGHSPDISDAIMFNMYFHIESIKKSTGKYSLIKL